MRTFKFSDDKSYKFWNIELEGSQFTVTFGRIGTQGQTQVKEFANAAAAQKAHDKLIAEKTGKGYVETTGSGPSKPTVAPPAETANVLEQALIEDPDDLATVQAYADELSERGDPRGEFIQTQLALEDPKRTPAERKQLAAREQELLKKYQAAWLGPTLAKELKSLGRTKVTFARGWLSSLQAPSLNADTAEALVQSPAARFLRELAIEGGEGWVQPLFKAPFLGSLRKLSVGESEIRTHFFGDELADLVERLPAIEELEICAHAVDAAKLFRLKNLGRLRLLALHCSDSYPLEQLAKNPSLGRLESIAFHPHGNDFDQQDEFAYIKTPGLKSLVGSKTLTSLQHVSLNLTQFGDKGIDLIVKSGVLRQWKTLNLSLGCVTDTGAAALAACPDLKRLERLDLSRNALTKAGIKLLKAAGVADVRLHDQHSGDVEDYLYEGDWE